MSRLARFTNNATSRLAANLSAGGLTLTVTPGDGAKFPSLTGGQYFTATLVKADGTKEVVKVTARATDTFTITRAYESVGGVQAAFAFLAGDKIELRMTAGALGDEMDRLDRAAYTRAATKSANYSVLETDISTLIRVDTSGGSRTITLPAVSSLTDSFEIVVTKITADTNLVNVTVTVGDTINGGSTYSLSSAFQSAWVIADRATNTWTAINSGTGGSAPVVDSFTGSGTSGPFTLSGDPVSKNNTAVFIGGVYQQKSTYTLSAGAITAGGTVAAGVPVEVVWSRPVALGSTTDDLIVTAPAPGGLWTTVRGFIAWMYARYAELVGQFGSSLIGFVRSEPSAVARSVNSKLSDFVSVKDFGVVGDGVTDDAAALNAAGALGIPLFIPYTSTGYKIGSTVTFSCSVVCEGFFTPTSAIGAAGNDYDRFAIILASSGYAQKRRFVGIKVVGSVALRAANVSGIRNDCENSYSQGLHVSQLNYGIVARSYSQTYDKCNANQCNTNLDGYARSASLEINALTIIGGNYDSPVSRSMYLGDTSWSDAWGGSNYHGSVIQITGGANFDGGEAKIDWCTCVSIDTCYFETSVTNYGIVLGSADNSVRNITIKNCFFKSLRIAIKCLAAVNGINVGRNFYTGVTHSALYCTSDLYFVEYHAGDATASFTLGREFHTGFRSLPVASITFANITFPEQGLYRGRQTLLEDVGVWYPSGVLQSGTTISTNVASSACRYYTTPATAKAGTVVGNVFTFTTPADCASFNGGDAIVTAPAGAVNVRSVDYEAGTMVMDNGTTPAGAATVSQQARIFFSQTVTFTGVPPTSGSWVLGDIAENGTGTTGQAVRWKRVTTGSGNVLGTDWKVAGLIS